MKALLLGLLLGCGDKQGGDTAPAGDGGGDTGEGLDPATVPLAGVCPQATRFGRFTVDSNEDYAFVTGSAADGVVPTAVLTELVSEGGCTIWRRENPFCDPACGSGFTCALDGTCVPYPENQDLGDVTVTGLSQAVAMSPVAPSFSYYDTSLPNPPWTPGGVVTLRTAGGAWDPVTLHGVSPADLSLETNPWHVVPGEDFAVAWDPAPPGVRTEVVLDLRVDQHGITPSSLQCIFPDTGAGVVPATVLDALIDVGLTGFPAGALARRTADHADLGAEGCLELLLTSSRNAQVEIEGYTPCQRDEECPDGMECNEALERCE